MKKLLAFLALFSLAAFQVAGESPGLRVWSAETSTPTVEAQVNDPSDAATDLPADATADAAAPGVVLPDSPPAPLLGASVVIDPAHIAETVKNIQEAYQRYLQLVEMVKKAERNLERLRRLPFVDNENFTGAFLADMDWLLAGGNYDGQHPELVEETLGYSHPEIVELLGEYFPGPRIVPGTGEDDEPQLRPDPWETYENPAELYFARDNAMLQTAYRVAEVLENHAAQVSRERRGIAWQREQADDADGNSQHLEMLFAALHQSLDAQSVERQVGLLGANLQYLDFADKVDARLEARTLAWHHMSSLLETLEIEPLTSAGGTAVGLDPFHP